MTKSLTSVLVFFCLVSCTNSDEVNTPNKLPGDFTQQEHCVENFELSILSRDIELYSETHHDDYVDVLSDKVRRSRENDIAAMRNFLSKSFYIESRISKGSWNPIEVVEGAVCEDCWETLREHETRLQSKKDSRLTVNQFNIRIIVKPVSDNDVVRYKIYRTILVKDNKEK